MSTVVDLHVERLRVVLRKRRGPLTKAQVDPYDLAEVLDDRDRLLAEAERLRVAVAAARELHVVASYGPYCLECTHGCGGGDVEWPCLTLRALDLATS